MIALPSSVTPCVGVWIETTKIEFINLYKSVTPCVGVWIETKNAIYYDFKNEVTPCVGVWIETKTNSTRRLPYVVTPCVGVWIETNMLPIDIHGEFVTPCVGVWIETSVTVTLLSCKRSHPAWVCGLKQVFRHLYCFARRHTLRGCVDWNTLRFRMLALVSVTPCVGVWIETSNRSTIVIASRVTPCVGVWIETFQRWRYSVARMSHPAWVCGLKHQ